MCVYECVRRSLSLCVSLPLKMSIGKRSYKMRKKLLSFFHFSSGCMGKGSIVNRLFRRISACCCYCCRRKPCLASTICPRFLAFALDKQTNKQTNETILFRLLPFLFVKTNWLKSNANASITESEALQSKRAMFAFLIEKILFIFAIVQCAPRNTN